MSNKQLSDGKNERQTIFEYTAGASESIGKVGHATADGGTGSNPTFQSYLNDLNSTTSCCRSASLLLPIVPSRSSSSESLGEGRPAADVNRHNSNNILQMLRKWEWLCESMLIQPWQRKSDSINHSTTTKTYHQWYYECLPSREEILFINEKFSLQANAHDLDIQTELVQRHLESKSLLVPLNDTATAFVLRVLFEMPHLPELNSQESDDSISGFSLKTAKTEDHQTNMLFSDPEQYQKAQTFQDWIRHSGVTLVHNCDGNQTISLSKEVDSFPSPKTFGNTNQCDYFTFVDLFAGIGGFRIGMEALGGKCIGSCEIDPFARETYKQNFLRTKKSGKHKLQPHESEHKNNEFFVSDIARLYIPPDTVDCLCGGFPCQSFSTLARCSSGKKKKNARGGNKTGQSKERRQGGLLTPQKGMLFFHLLRILRHARPKLFVFENVKGLLHLDSGNHLEKILALLRDSGYHVTHGVVDASWFLPQRRERVFFVGVRLDLMERGCPRALFDPIALKEKYQLYSNDYIITEASCLDRYHKILAKHGYHTNGRKIEQKQQTSRLGNFLESEDSIFRNNPHCYLTKHQWEKVRKQTYLQIHSDGSGRLLTREDPCAQTLVSSYRQSYLLHSQFVVPCDSVHLKEQQERMIVEAMRYKDTIAAEAKERLFTDCQSVGPSANVTLPRFFTPRECCRLQGFPEHFDLPFDGTSGANEQRNLISQFYRQIGNAVCPPCVAAVAENAVKTLLLVSNGEDNGIGGQSPIFFLVLQASPFPLDISQ